MYLCIEACDFGGRHGFVVVLRDKAEESEDVDMARRRSGCRSRGHLGCGDLFLAPQWSRAFAAGRMRSGRQHRGGTRCLGKHRHLHWRRADRLGKPIRVMRKLCQTIIWFAAATLALGLMTTPARTAGDASVMANLCAVAAGDEASGNTLNCYIGLTPEQLRGLTNLAAGVGPAPAGNVGEIIARTCAVAAKGDAKNNKLHCNVGPAALVDQIKDISGKFEITEQAALTLLRIVGEDPSIPDEKLASALIKVAEDYKRLKAQVGALNPDNPRARSLAEQAKAEIDAAHFAQAHELLRQATEAQFAAAQEARKLKAQAQAAEDAQISARRVRRRPRATFR